MTTSRKWLLHAAKLFACGLAIASMVAAAKREQQRRTVTPGAPRAELGDAGKTQLVAGPRP
jgi:hypothetical protein